MSITINGQLYQYCRISLPHGEVVAGIRSVPQLPSVETYDEDDNCLGTFTFDVANFRKTETVIIINNAIPIEADYG